MREIRRHEDGFTLIEIMAVVLIIGLLTTIVGIAVFPQIDKSRVSTARLQIKNLDAALESYRMEQGRFPPTLQGLISAPPEARDFPPGGYLKERRIPVDPWGNPYQYEAPGSHNSHSYDLWSYGADATAGGTGTDSDLGNWFDDADVSG